MVSLIAVVGLSLDGGKVVQTYSELASLSASTARIGGQQVAGIRDGELHVDEFRARQVMTNFLNLHGEVGSFQIADNEISVTLRRKVTMSFLQLLGVFRKTVEVTRTVTVVKG